MIFTNLESKGFMLSSVPPLHPKKAQKHHTVFGHKKRSKFHQSCFNRIDFVHSTVQDIFPAPFYAKIHKIRKSSLLLPKVTF